MNERYVTHATRIEIVERHREGESLLDISQAIGINYYTARKWWRRWCKVGWEALTPKPPGPTAKSTLCRFEPMVRYVALRLKREHPGWGVDLLLLHMSRRPSLQGKPLPGRSSLAKYLQSYLTRLAPQRRLPTHRPAPTVVSPSGVHVRWQMDFKGSVKIDTIGHVAPLNICDEYSSAPLACQLFTGTTARPEKGVTFRDIQHCLRDVFSHWGLPQQLRIDRDSLWVGSARLEWPGTLLLWLVGLGVSPLINRPRQPTDNAQVERLNRTWFEHVGRGARVHSMQQLQTLSDEAWHDRRHYLPSRNPHCIGRPPVVAFPELTQPQRPYHPAEEAFLFDMQRVYHYLAEWEWQRKVDAAGCISMADTNRLVSKRHKGHIVKIRFDPQQSLFIAKAVDGTSLNTFTLPVIDASYIMGTGS